MSIGSAFHHESLLGLNDLNVTTPIRFKNERQLVQVQKQIGSYQT